MLLPSLEYTLSRLEDPDSVEAHSASWRPLSLARGSCSLALLFCHPAAYRKKALKGYIDKLLVTLTATPLSDLSLFDGLAGVAYTLRTALAYDTSYHKLLATVDSLIINNLTHTSGWDLTHGAAGVGLYLAYAKKQEVTVLIHQIITLCTPQKIPGWYLSKDNQFIEEDKAFYPNGNCNLGLAHGAAGMLFFLAFAAKQGFMLPGQKEAMRYLASWLMDKALVKDGYTVFPERVSLETELGLQEHKGLIRMAWCYGNPGVLRSLFLAAAALEDKTLLHYAHQEFCNIFTLDEKVWYLPSATLCHGLAGLLLLTQTMAQETLDPYLFEQCRKLSDKIVSHFDPDAPFGFYNLEPSAGSREEQSTTFTRQNNAGLVDGAAGIVYALLNQQHMRTPNALLFC